MKFSDLKKTETSNVEDKIIVNKDVKKNYLIQQLSIGNNKFKFEVFDTYSQRTVMTWTTKELVTRTIKEVQAEVKKYVDLCYGLKNCSFNF